MLISLIWVAIFLLAVPISVLSIECILSLLPVRSVLVNSKSPRPRIAVLVPAHNEASGIGATLESLMPQLTKQDQLVVIADNCTDGTALASRLLGVTVLERHDSHNRGKGYALDYGLQYLKNDPPEVVFVVDADCRVDPQTVENAAYLAKALDRPMQVIDLLAPPVAASLKDQISAFAFTVNNLVRPRGLLRLGLPCMLKGTGMAFPWSILQKVSLASSSIVEDMQLCLDLALAGHFPLFCTGGRVTGVLPQQEHIARSQRTRWEHGHLKTLLTQVPKLLKAAIIQRRFELLVMALDLGIPPLSLLVLMWSLLTFSSVILGLLTVNWMPSVFLTIEGFLLFLSISLAWVKFGQSQLPITSLLAVPFYVLWKIPIYLTFLIRPQSDWIRTERE